MAPLSGLQRLEPALAMLALALAAQEERLRALQDARVPSGRAGAKLPQGERRGRERNARRSMQILQVDEVPARTIWADAVGLSSSAETRGARARLVEGNPRHP